MELPSSRELELEILLREKDSQLAEVTDEIQTLRHYLSKQPGPSATDSVTLPPALFSVLLPHITSAADSTFSSASSTVTAALTERARLLQEENDELYELLKHSETGRLKDEVRGLRRVVAKLEEALKESHHVISSLSTELDIAYETLKHSSRQTVITDNSKSHSHSPQNSYYPIPHSESSGNGSSARPPPTEPRAYKRPRLSESQPQVHPPPRLAPSLPQKPQTHHNSHSQNHLPMRVDTRSDGRNFTDNRGKVNAQMEVDSEEMVSSPAIPNRERDRTRERERNNRDRERGTKERDRPPHNAKDWDRDGGKNANARRNGHASGPSGRGAGNGNAPGRKGNNSTNHNSDQGSRTLQERLGL